MSLHYLLDGYNIVKQIPSLSGKDLESYRLALYKFIEAHQPQGSLSNRITVVFDGKVGIGSRNEHSLIKTIFSKNRTADEEIKDLVQHSQNPACLIIVTDDRDLKLDVRSKGAKIMSVREFLNKRKTRSRISEEGKDISFDAAYKINSELSSLWLKAEDGSRQKNRNPRTG